MAKFSHAVLPGGLSDADRGQIITLAERGWTPTRIARKLSKHPSTIYWYMCRTGLKGPSRVATGREYRRGDTVVRCFSTAEDLFIQEQRLAGLNAGAIGRQLGEEFGHKRTSASVSLRLLMLASKEES